MPDPRQLPQKYCSNINILDKIAGDSELTNRIKMPVESLLLEF